MFDTIRTHFESSGYYVNITEYHVCQWKALNGLRVTTQEVEDWLQRANHYPVRCVVSDYDYVVRSVCGLVVYGVRVVGRVVV